MRRRQKSNSIWEAEGKPISICLKPMPTSMRKYSSFSSTLMGWARAWLPSRRSTLHQIGAEVRLRFGHWRSGRSIRGKGRYLVTGGCCMSSSTLAPHGALRQVFKKQEVLLNNVHYQGGGIIPARSLDCLTNQCRSCLFPDSIAQDFFQAVVVESIGDPIGAE